MGIPLIFLRYVTFGADCSSLSIDVYTALFPRCPRWAHTRPRPDFLCIHPSHHLIYFLIHSYLLHFPISVHLYSTAHSF